MKTLNVFSNLVLFASLGTSAQATLLKDYRVQTGVSAPERVKAEKATEARISKLRTALGYKKLQFVAPNTTYQNVARGASSSLFLKRLLSKVGEGYKNQESYGKPGTVDPSLFGYEIDQVVDARNQNTCMKVLGEDKYGKNKETLINQLYRNIYDSKSLRQTNLKADVANGYQSPLANAIGNYIRKNGQEAILNRLGGIYQIEVIDGIPNRIRFAHSAVGAGNRTVRPIHPNFPNVVLADDQTISLSLEMLATMASDYDRYFLMGSGCLLNLINQEVEKVDKEYHGIVDSFLYKYTCQGCAIAPQVLKKLAKVQAVRKYVLEKHQGAIHAHNLVGGLDRKQLFFLIDLFLQLRGNDIPSARDIGPLTELAYNRQKVYTTTSPATATTHDQIFYGNLEEELFRVEEYVREYVEVKNVNDAIINKIKGGRG